MTRGMLVPAAGAGCQPTAASETSPGLAQAVQAVAGRKSRLSVSCLARWESIGFCGSRLAHNTQKEWQAVVQQIGRKYQVAVLHRARYSSYD